MTPTITKLPTRHSILNMIMSIAITGEKPRIPHATTRSNTTLAHTMHRSCDATSLGAACPGRALLRDPSARPADTDGSAPASTMLTPALPHPATTESKQRTTTPCSNHLINEADLIQEVVTMPHHRVSNNHQALRHMLTPASLV